MHLKEQVVLTVQIHPNCVCGLMTILPFSIYSRVSLKNLQGLFADFNVVLLLKIKQYIFYISAVNIWL